MKSRTLIIQPFCALVIVRSPLFQQISDFSQQFCLLICFLGFFSLFFCFFLRLSLPIVRITIKIENEIMKKFTIV